jgi:hypothetical protein
MPFSARASISAGISNVDRAALSAMMSSISLSVLVLPLASASRH